MKLLHTKNGLFQSLNTLQAALYWTCCLTIEAAHTLTYWMYLLPPISTLPTHPIYTLRTSTHIHSKTKLQKGQQFKIHQFPPGGPTQQMGIVSPKFVQTFRDPRVSTNPTVMRYET